MNKEKFRLYQIQIEFLCAIAFLKTIVIELG
jgi:hypothetical protein